VGALSDITEIAHDHYGEFEVKIRDLPRYQNRNGTVLGKAYFHDKSNDDPIVDLTFSAELAGSFIRKEYETRHWFHELSGE
jgi:hypothetical protein